MTAPRQILRNASHMITRACLGRMFLLRPSPLVNSIVQYVLAVAAARYGMELHAFCILSNHYHIVLTDPLGQLPAFEQFFDAMVARAINSLHGRWDYFWESGSYNQIELQTPEDILDRVAYTLANPVKAGLVRRGAEWPGLWSAPEQIGGAPIQVQRPDHFFRPGGTMPETAELRLVCPDGFESVEAFQRQLIEALAEREAQAASDLEAEGRPFAGAARVLAQSPQARPSKPQPRRGLKPRVASREAWRRVAAIYRLKRFLAEYREALARFRRGVRDAVFPAGTYWMRVAYGVPCAASG